MAISGRLELVAPGSSAARAGDNAFESMLSGWRDQQLARNLNVVTIEARERLVRRFRLHAQAWPWEWLPGHLEAWVAELRIVEHRAHSTVRSYQLAVGGFCDYLCDPAYGWGASCLVEFGSVPSQVCRAENLATHTTEYEGRPHRRSLTRTELQDFFDAADDHVETIRSRGSQGLGARVPGRHDVEGGVCVGASASGAAHARGGRLRPEPSRTRVRRLRRVLCALGQGGQGQPASSA
jgi:integrase/recombinase XerC